MTIRVVLADDHPIVLDGVSALLKRHAAIRVVATAESAEALHQALRERDCDVVVADFGLHGPDDADGADGLELLGRLHREHPLLPVVVYTMTTDASTLRAIIAAGVRGLVIKSDAPTELPAAICAVAEGHRHVSPLAQAQLRQAAPTSASVLSRRELEVLQIFADGHRVSEIARRLDRSIKTVSCQKKAAMAKLGLWTDLDIYLYVRDTGLASPRR